MANRSDRDPWVGRIQALCAQTPGVTSANAIFGKVQHTAKLSAEQTSVQNKARVNSSKSGNRTTEHATIQAKVKATKVTAAIVVTAMVAAISIGSAYANDAAFLASLRALTSNVSGNSFDDDISPVDVNFPGVNTDDIYSEDGTVIINDAAAPQAPVVVWEQTFGAPTSLAEVQAARVAAAAQAGVVGDAVEAGESTAALDVVNHDAPATVGNFYLLRATLTDPEVDGSVVVEALTSAEAFQAGPDGWLGFELFAQMIPAPDLPLAVTGEPDAGDGSDDGEGGFETGSASRLNHPQEDAVEGDGATDGEGGFETGSASRLNHPQEDAPEGDGATDGEGGFETGSATRLNHPQEDAVEDGEGGFETGSETRPDYPLEDADEDGAVIEDEDGFETGIATEGEGSDDGEGDVGSTDSTEGDGSITEGDGATTGEVPDHPFWTVTFDRLEILDVTPNVVAQFDPDAITAGGLTTLTFTIVNTSELLDISGDFDEATGEVAPAIHFSVNLPEGLVVADPDAPASEGEGGFETGSASPHRFVDESPGTPSASRLNHRQEDAVNTCASGAVTAVPGEATITMAANLGQGQADCTMTVAVTAANPGSYQVAAENFQIAQGVSASAATTILTVTEPEPDLETEAPECADGQELTDGECVEIQEIEQANPQAKVPAKAPAVIAPMSVAIPTVTTPQPPADAITCTLASPVETQLRSCITNNTKVNIVVSGNINLFQQVSTPIVIDSGKQVWITSQGTSPQSLVYAGSKLGFQVNGAGSQLVLQNITLNGNGGSTNNSMISVSGGTLYVGEGATIIGSTLTLLSGNGTAINASNGAHIYVNNASIHGLRAATGNGGAIWADAGTVLSVANSSIADNTAYIGSGGGIFMNSSASNPSTLNIVGNYGDYSNSMQSNWAGANGGSIYAGPAANVVIDSAVISNSIAGVNSSTAAGTGSGHGGAIYLAPGANASNLTNLTVQNGAQIDSNFAGYIYVNSTTTATTNTASNGGAIYADDYTNVTIDNSQITNNGALIGGGGISVGHSNQTLQSATLTTTGNTLIDSNKAGNYGGGILADAHSITSITDTTISNNRAGMTSGGSGGGISTASKLILGGQTKIIGNKAGYDVNNQPLSGAGGGVILTGSDQSSISTLNITGNVLIQDNWAPGQGGGINFSWSDGGNTITGATFDSNHANEGAGLYIGKSGGQFTGQQPDVISNSTFTNNQATQYAGAIGTFGNLYLTLQGSTLVQGNTAQIDGGGLRIGYSDQVLIKDTTTITGNTAVTGTGGGISVASGSGSSLELQTGTSVTNNTAGTDGGGIYTAGWDPITLTGAHIDGNKAGRSGGGLYTGFAQTLNITGGSVSNNVAAQTADGNGGGLYLGAPSSGYTSVVNLTGIVQVNGNKVGYTSANTTPPTPTGHIGDGGGIWAGNGVTVNVLTNATVGNNYATRDGGGIWAGNGNAVTVSGVGAWVQMNTAARNGGGIALGDNASLTLGTMAYVNQNVATTGSGGAVASGANATVTFTGTTSSNGASANNNTAAGDGGGFYLPNGANVVLNYASIGDNTAGSAGRGGGIYLGDVTAPTVNSITGVGYFISNSAAKGGGIYLGANGTASLTSGSQVVLNHAASDGGGVWVANNASLALTDTTISNNTANTGDGGGVYLASGYTSMSVVGTSAFQNNHADNGDGGAIWVDWTSPADLQKLTVASGATFGSNTAASFATSVAPADLVIYNANIVPTTWSTANGSALAKGYNNYDIAYAYDPPSCPPGFKVDGTTDPSYGIAPSTSTVSNWLVGDETVLNQAFADTAPNVNITLCGNITLTNSNTNVRLVETGQAMTITSDHGVGSPWSLIRGTTLTGNQSLVTVAANASLSATRVIFDGNAVPATLAALYTTGGTVTLGSETVVKNNINTTVAAQPSSLAALQSPSNTGGGIYGTASSTIIVKDGAVITNNQSAHAGGGIALMSNNTAGQQSTLMVSNSAQISNNSAGGIGGGIYAGGGAIVTIDNAIIQGNTATQTVSTFNGYGGGGIYFYAGGPDNSSGAAPSASVLTLNNATIIGNKTGYDANGPMASINWADGGGIYAGFFSTVNLQGDTKITGNMAKRWGGGLFVGQKSLIPLSGATEIFSNTGGTGGGLFVDSLATYPSTITMDATTSVHHNSAVGNTASTGEAGGIMLNGSGANITLKPSNPGDPGAKVEYNTANGYGGGIVMGAGNLTITDASVSNNLAGQVTGANGCSAGGIRVGSSISSDPISTIILTDAQITNNRAGYDAAGNQTTTSNSCYGGGISIGDNTTVTLLGTSEITGNWARVNGGGIAPSSGGLQNLVINLNAGTKISNNVAGTLGGGIWLDSTSTINMYAGSLLNGNSAGTNGGGIYVANGGNTLNVQGGIIKDNMASQSSVTTANTGGGGIYVYPTGTNTLTLNNAQITGNKAGLNTNSAVTYANSDGGGIYTGGDVITSITGGEISGNMAARNGGGVYAQATTTNPFTLSGTTVASNLAGVGAIGAGGGIYLSPGQSASVPSLLTLQNGAQVRGNKAGYDANGNPPTYSTTSSSVVDGGGIFAGNYTTITLNSGSIVGGPDGSDANMAYRNGGGIAAASTTTGNAKVVLNGASQVLNNKAGTSGGGIAINGNTSSVQLTGGAQVVNNVAQTTGGGIYMVGTSSTLTLDGTTVSASVFQPPIYDAFDQVRDYGFTFPAEFTLGAFSDGIFANPILLAANAPAGTAVYGNSAGTNGGGIYVGGGTTVAVNSGASVSGNTANQNGGGVYLTTGYTSMSVASAAHITDNVADADANGSGDGGGIWLRYASPTNNELTGLAVANGALFSGNVAATAALYRNPSDNTVYSNKISVPNNQWSVYNGTPLQQGYNNYDIAYAYTPTCSTGSSATAVSVDTATDTANYWVGSYGALNSAMNDSHANINVVLCADITMTANQSVISGKTVSITSDMKNTKNGGRWSLFRNAGMQAAMLGVVPGGSLTITNAIIDGQTAAGVSVDANYAAISVPGSGTGIPRITLGNGAIVQNNRNMAGGRTGSDPLYDGGGIHGHNGAVITLLGNAVIQNNVSSYGGGGIYISARSNSGTTYNLPSTIVIQDSASVSGNNAQNGGGVGIFGGTLTMSSGSITGNTGTAAGGGILLQDPTTANGYQGFPATAYQMSIANADISGNQTSGTGGGIAFESSRGNLSITNSTINNNSAGSSSSGGGILIGSTPTSSNPVTVTGGSISGNVAGNIGGGIAANTGASMLNLTGVTMTGNQSGASGGAIRFAGSILTVSGGVIGNSLDDNVPFSGPNTALTNGGGIAIANNATLNVQAGAVIQNNRAGINSAGGYGGGGIYTVGTSTSAKATLNITNAIISDNTLCYQVDGVTPNAVTNCHGGGIHADNYTNVNISGATISGNYATGQAGGLFASGTAASATITGNNGVNTVISNNHANSSCGGGIKVGGASGSGNGTSFSITDAEVSDNTAGTNGGGICLGQYLTSPVNITRTLISGNKSGVDASGVQGTNPLYYGGGLFTDWTQGTPAITVNLADSTVSQNSAPSSSGGGFAAASYATVNLTGATSFTDNTAAIDGGGLYLAPGATASVGGSVSFTGNTAVRDGGGIWVDWATPANLAKLSITSGATFSGNAADVGYMQHDPADDATYVAKIQSTAWTTPYLQGYNNYDIAYEYKKVCPPGYLDDVASTTSTGVYLVGSEQWLGNALADGRPNIDITLCNDVTVTSGKSIPITTTAVHITSDYTNPVTDAANPSGGVPWSIIRGTSLTNAPLISVPAGTTLTAERVTFDGASVSATKAALVTAGGTITLGNETTVKNNLNTSTNNTPDLGGGIHGDANSTINLIGTAVITGNSSGGNGGGIYTMTGSAVTLSGTVSGAASINYNTAAGAGGGIWAGTSATVTLNPGTLVTTNSAGYHGGGIYMDAGSNSTLTIDSATVSENLATQSDALASVGSQGQGGGIYVAASNTSPSNIILKGNAQIIDNKVGTLADGTTLAITVPGATCSAGCDGGGIMSGNNVSITLSDNAVIANNVTLRNGGGIRTGNNATIMLNDSAKITGNQAGTAGLSGDGGGIYVGNGGTKSTLIMNSGTEISGNVAARGGGGIWAWYNSTVEINNASVINNLAAQIASGYGGGIVLDQTSPYTNTIGAELILNNATITGNKAGFAADGTYLRSGNGGGIWAARYTNVTLNGSTVVSDNSASNNGGGIFTNTPSDTITPHFITLNPNSSVDHNTANASGGGIYLGPFGTLNVNGGSVNSNVAGQTTTGYGGGIYLSPGLAAVAADPSNGVVAADAVPTTLNLTDGAKVTSNKAGYGANGAAITVTAAANSDGGGIYAGNYTIVNLSDNSAVTSNLARRNGGGIATGTGAVVNSGIAAPAPEPSVEMGEYAALALTAQPTAFALPTLTMHGGGVSTSSTTDVGGFEHATTSRLNHIYGFVSFSAPVPGDPNFTGVVIQSNTAGTNGGGIYAGTGSSLDLVNTLIDTNGAGQFGGGIFAAPQVLAAVNGSTLSNNRSGLVASMPYGDGGGIYLGTAVASDAYSTTGRTQLTVTNGSVITGNTAGLDVGGNSVPISGGARGAGIFASDYWKVDIDESSEITFNIARDSGGGIFDGNYTNLTLTDAVINNNTAGAGNGGGICSGTAPGLTVTRTSISDNNAALNGGGIWIGQGANVLLDSSFVLRNKAGLATSGSGGAMGGGIMLYSGVNTSNRNILTLTNTDVSYNTVGYQADGVTLNTAFCTSASPCNGGGISGNSFLNITLENGSTITENKAFQDGGGLRISSDTALDISDSLIDGNLTGKRGGGINASLRSTIDLDNAIVSNNLAGQNAATTDSDGYGGGIYIGNGSATDGSDRSVLSMTNGSAVTGNLAGLTLDVNSQPVYTGVLNSSGNAAGYAGGIFAGNYHKVVIADGSLVSENQAYNSGGGILTGGNALVQATGSDITDNVSLTSNGGGISLGNTSQLQLSAANVTGNIANNGGGILVNNADVNVTPTVSITDGSVISGNTARQQGGGLYTFNNVSVTVDQGSVFGGPNPTDANTAATEGGAIRLGVAATLSLTDAFVTGNQALSHGGGIYAAAGYGQIDVTGTTEITNNHTNKNGGGIWVSYTAPGAANNELNKLFVGSDSVFHDNTAAKAEHTIDPLDLLIHHANVAVLDYDWSDDNPSDQVTGNLFQYGYNNYDISYPIDPTCPAGLYLDAAFINSNNELEQWVKDEILDGRLEMSDNAVGRYLVGAENWIDVALQDDYSPLPNNAKRDNVEIILCGNVTLANTHPLPANTAVTVTSDTEDGAPWSLIRGSGLKAAPLLSVPGTSSLFATRVYFDGAQITGVTSAALTVDGASGTAVDNPGTITLGAESIVRNNDNTLVSPNYDDITVSGGGVHGAAGSTVILQDGAIVTNNSAAARGGGIGVDSTSANPSHVIVQSGASVDNNASLGNPNVGEFASSGGGIYAGPFSTVLVTGAGTAVSHNSAAHRGGGIAVHQSSQVSVLNGATVDSNVAAQDENAEGGGINMREGATVNGVVVRPVLTLTNAKIINNWVGYDFEGNDTEHVSSGGGVHVGANTDVSIDGSTVISGNRARTNGGGLAADANAVVTVADTSAITTNTAGGNGGGIYGATNTDISITTDSSVNAASGVQANIAGGNGGGIYASDTATVTLSNGAAVLRNAAATSGGGIYGGQNGQVSLTDAFVNENVATTGAGGGIGSPIVGANNSDTALTITALRTQVNDNKAGSDGGGIYVGRSSTLTLTDSFVQRNYGAVSSNGMGGGIYLANGATESDRLELIVNNTKVTANKIGYTPGATPANDTPNDSFCVPPSGTCDGGGIGGGSFVAITLLGGSELSGNMAAVNGGGIAISTDSLIGVTDKSVIDGNIAGKRGGGIYAMNTNAITVDDAYLTNNRSGQNTNNVSASTDGSGGGMYIVNWVMPDAYATTVTLTNGAVVTDNYAALDGSATATGIAGNGGGIYAGNANTVIVSQGANVSANKAQGNGGGIYAGSMATVTVNPPNAPTPAPAVEPSSVVEPVLPTRTMHGGGVHTSWVVEAFGTGSSETAWSTYPLGNGSLASGSASASTYADPLNLTGVTITNNTAGNSGGGIYGGAYSTATITDADINTNWVGTNGGGIYGDDHSTVTVTNSTISDNLAAQTQQGAGGGIYVFTNSTINLDNATVAGNKSGILSDGTPTNIIGDGGGLYAAQNATISVANLTEISGNAVSRSGGGIGVNATSKLDITASKVINNLAGQSQNASDGGGINLTAGTSTTPSTLKLNNATITGNMVGVRQDVLAAPGTPLLVDNKPVLATAIGGAAITGTGGGVRIGNFATITADATTIIANNYARNNGGGIAAGTSTNSTATPTEVAISITGNPGATGLVTNNWAGSNGGGIYLFANSAELENVQVAGNVAGQATNGSGGGIYVDANGSANGIAALTLSDSIVSGNYSGYLADGVTTTGISGADGGGIGVDAYASVSLLSAQVSGNKAIRNGGGIYLTQDYNRLAVTGTSFITDNHAGRDGGGIWERYVSPTDNELGNPDESSVGLTVASTVTFSGNTAATVSPVRNPGDDAVYAANIGVADDAWSVYPATSGSPLPQGYNNYDIAYHAAPLTVVKVDGATDADLVGAEFKLYSDAALTSEVVTLPVTPASTSDPAGEGDPSGSDSPIVAAWTTALAYGETYYLVETRAPAGYRLLAEPIVVTVSSVGVITANLAPTTYTCTVPVDAQGVVTGAAVGSAGTGCDYAGDATLLSYGTSLFVRNYTGIPLPRAGGLGTPLWVWLVPLTLTALTVLAIKRDRPTPRRRQPATV